MPQKNRQLAAIMFTDIAGYTSLMGEDEDQAFELLKANREIQKPLIKQFNGRWLKEIGDGVLASFNTVSDAVYCAGAIQKASSNIPNLNLRIGIHLGEVVFEDGDVFGDGVNIASRLEPLAPIGGILVSESVNRNLVNKKGIESIFVDEKELKNVKNPIKVYEVKVTDIPSTHQLVPSEKSIKNDAQRSGKSKKQLLVFATVAILILLGAIYFIYNYNDKDGTASNIEKDLPIEKSIAVLPFSDFSPNKDQEWFSDGLTEELLNCLARLPELQVTARTSSFAFKGKDLPVKLIADSLGVNYILEGSVRKAGDVLRVTAQLINTNDDFHLWSENYDREPKDIFAIQEDLANKIAASLDVYLDEEKRNQMFAFGTRNPTAYEYYMQGNVYFDQGHSGGGIFKLAEANNYYEKAIKADPDFAAPWYRHQDVYSHLLTLTSDEVWPDTLTKEVALNQILYDVNNAKSKAKNRAEALFYEMEYAMVSGNWNNVPDLFGELEANPDYLGPISHFGGGWSRSLFIALERTDIGLKVAEHQLANDPLDSRINSTIMMYLMAEDKMDSARYWANKFYPTTQRGTGFSDLILNPDEATRVIEKLSGADENDPTLIYAKIILGDNSLPYNFESTLNRPGTIFSATYIYNLIGEQSKADSLANVLDSRYMGYFTISDLIIHAGGKIAFNLDATPNFSKRLKEGGITDLDAYQKRHWVNLNL